jgi:hypothetical protein
MFLYRIPWLVGGIFLLSLAAVPFANFVGDRAEYVRDRASLIDLPGPDGGGGGYPAPTVVVPPGVDAELIRDRNAWEQWALGQAPSGQLNYIEDQGASVVCAGYTGVVTHPSESGQDGWTLHVLEFEGLDPPGVRLGYPEGNVRTLAEGIPQQTFRFNGEGSQCP